MTAVLTVGSGAGPGRGRDDAEAGPDANATTPTRTRERTSSVNDLLLRLARQAAERAYVPYSSFRVGAAVETPSGDSPAERFLGCNVENASYGLTVCAERVALFAAVAAGHRRVARLAVSCVDAGPELGAAGRMPCGACRQVMAELMGPAGVVLVDGVGSFRVSDLLPSAFTL